jgi:hypothetical protein
LVSKLRIKKTETSSTESIKNSLVSKSTLLLRCLISSNDLPCEVEPISFLSSPTLAEDFNESWDDSFGEFVMGDYSYPASEILFNVDKQAYVNEYKSFTEGDV